MTNYTPNESYWSDYLVACSHLFGVATNISKFDITTTLQNKFKMKQYLPDEKDERYSCTIYCHFCSSATGMVKYKKALVKPVRAPDIRHYIF